MERKRVLSIVVKGKMLSVGPVSEVAEIVVVAKTVSIRLLLSPGSHISLLLPFASPKPGSKTFDVVVDGDDAALITRLEKDKEVIDDNKLSEEAVDVAGNPVVVADAPDGLAANEGKYEVKKLCEDETADVRPVVLASVMLELCSTRDTDEVVSVVNLTMLTEVRTMGELVRFEDESNADNSEPGSLELGILTLCSFGARSRAAELVEE